MVYKIRFEGVWVKLEKTDHWLSTNILPTVKALESNSDWFIVPSC